MKKPFLWMFLLLLVLSMPLFSQSNSLIDDLLDQEQATIALASYIVLSSGGIISEDASPDSAAETVLQRQWMRSDKGSDDFISLGEFCFIVMKTYELQGGVMYRIFPGPRYAARELVYRNFVYGNTSPYRGISGNEALHILRSVLDAREG